ncbi:MAG TPA: hypothetical protein VJW73_15720 [Gemmatimonadaceae bacterium]|nr:hypothetical protein [Gemmatimonadaceae bacterium]
MEAIRWDTRKDTFERGQWFNGRIHEDRSDLSPNGELFVYLAMQYGSERGKEVWTGISKPPWFIPLALWSKDHTYYGGGVFLDDHRLLLNHPPSDAVPRPGCEPKSDLRVDANPKPHAEYVQWHRLERDGWVLRQEMVFERVQAKNRYTMHYVTHIPEERVRRPPADGMPLIVLARRLAKSYSIVKEFRVEGASNEIELPPGPLDWLDWDLDGRLIALSGGRIWAATLDGNRISRFAELLDLLGDAPEERTPPPSAREW